MTPEVGDLHADAAARPALLALNNRNARETSLLSREKFDVLIASASVATFIPPSDAYLIAFAHTDAYDGVHFLWFRTRLDTFLYNDRVVVAESRRRHGLGQLLYEDLFKRAEELGHSNIVCEVNSQPPNPSSDAFHAALGFVAIGEATINGGAKTVRYLHRHVWRDA